jgi:hypothetical protein
MVESIGNNTITVDLSRSATTKTNSTSITTEEPQSTSISLDVQAVSPQMRADPIAGVVITEYLSEDGQVRMQMPSEAAVAYLRSGLTASGLPNPEDAQQKASKDTLA